MTRRGLKEGLTATSDLREALVADGYVQRSHPRLTSSARIDAEVAAKVTCPNCGHYGMTCETWIHEARFEARKGGYRALASCPRCPHGQEL